MKIHLFTIELLFQVYLSTQEAIPSYSFTKITHLDLCTRRHTGASFGTAGISSVDAVRQSYASTMREKWPKASDATTTIHQLAGWPRTVNLIAFHLYPIEIHSSIKIKVFSKPFVFHCPFYIICCEQTAYFYLHWDCIDKTFSSFI